MDAAASVILIISYRVEGRVEYMKWSQVSERPIRHDIVATPKLVFTLLPGSLLPTYARNVAPEPTFIIVNADHEFFH